MQEKTEHGELKREIRQVLEELLKEAVPQPIPWVGSGQAQVRLVTDLLPTLAAVVKTPCVCVCSFQPYDTRGLDDRLNRAAEELGLTVSDLLAALERRTLKNCMRQQVETFLDRWERCGTEAGSVPKAPL